MGGHMGASKTYKNARRFYYWPGMFDWICAITADCLTCLNNKPQPKHRKEVPLEEWQNETVLLGTIHIDPKGHLHLPSNRNFHCLLVIDAFSRFLMVYPVTNSGVKATISAVKKWMHPFGILQSIVHDWGTAFIFLILLTEQKNWESMCDLELHTRLGRMGTLKLKINTLAVIGGTFSTTLETNGLLWHRSSLLLTIPMSTTPLEKQLTKLILVQNLKLLCL